MIEIHKPIPLLKKLLPLRRPEQDILYVPSQFALAFDHNDRQYVYNTLTKQLIEAQLPGQCRAGEEYDELITSYFLVPEDKDESVLYRSISELMRIYTKKDGEKGYIILPTLRCNARCVYCYEENYKPVTMSPETVEQTIRYIIDSRAGDMVNITWFGGEPLLCVNTIDRISEGLKEAGVSFKSTMISNGALVTPEIVDKMSGAWNIKHIQISMDGTERDYIERKNYYKYKDQYHSAISGINLMAEKGIRVIIRCNIDDGNFDGLPDFLDDMKAEIKDKDKVSIYLSPLFHVRASDDALNFWKKTYRFSLKINEAGFGSNKINGFRETFKLNFCMADAGGVVICPDGTLSPCEHLQGAARFGDVWNGVTDEGARREFCRTDRIREKCRKCPFLPDCTGFASCPITDSHCRELHNMQTLDALKYFIDNKVINSDDDVPVC